MILLEIKNLNLRLTLLRNVQIAEIYLFRLSLLGLLITLRLSFWEISISVRALRLSSSDLAYQELKLYVGTIILIQKKSTQSNLVKRLVFPNYWFTILRFTAIKCNVLIQVFKNDVSIYKKISFVRNGLK